MTPLARAFASSASAVILTLPALAKSPGPSATPAAAPAAPPAAASPVVHREAAPAESADSGLASLQKVVEEQSVAIKGLIEEVRELRQKVDGREAAPAAPEPSETAATPAPAEHGEPEIPKAEATGGGIKHIVAKGETLTSIAKHYNIPLADLQKANKNLNDRKMQIGQVLNIPSSSTPATATPPPEKKETP